MITTYLETHNGISIKDPQLSILRKAANDVLGPNGEFRDCWLVDQDDWMIKLFSDKRVSLENQSKGVSPCFIVIESVAEVLEIWAELQLGQHEKITARPWKL